MAVGNRDPHNLRSQWRRQRAVDRWRRLSNRWWGPGQELDFRCVWSTWLQAHDGDQPVALAHLLLAVDRAGLLDDASRRPA